MGRPLHELMLEDFHAIPDEEQNELPYDDLLTLRAQAYKQHVEKMATPAPIDAFVKTMVRRFGPTVTIWKNTVDDWRVALLLATWGEEPAHWPAEFGPVEIEYARKWAAGRTPGGPVVVTYHPNK